MTLEINAVSVYRDRNGIEVEVKRRRQRDGSSLWSVNRLSSVLTKDGYWVYEPNPSSRDADFLRLTRWASMDEAIAAWLSAQAGKGE